MSQPPSVLAVVVLVFLIGSVSAGDDTETPACFNGGTEGDSIGVWIYEGHPRWQDAREDFKGALVFSFRPGTDAHDVEDLRYCGYTSKRKESTTCDSGVLTLHEVDSPNRVTGEYRFVMRDGTIKDGTFDASYCPPRSQSASDRITIG